MKIAVSSTGSDLDSQASPVFGRCPVYLFVDTETEAFEAVANPARSASSGAGIQAAQFVVGEGAQAVLSGTVGPNAFQVLQAAGVPVYSVDTGSARQALEAFKGGHLTQVTAPTAGAHAGRGWQAGAGGGRGRGTGRGRSSAPSAPAPPPPPIHPQEASEEDVQALKEEIQALRKQLSSIQERLEQLR